MVKVVTIILIALLAHFGLAQENAGTNISPSLEECYNSNLLVTRENRLPSTITTLIALIRKAEKGNPSVNARELSIQLLHRFRQDGIWHNDRIGLESEIGLPYTPRRWENFKYKIQLRDLTPGQAINFRNESLNLLQKCSLHSILSSTIEVNERGDESLVCNRISRYTMRGIRKRNTEWTDKSFDPATSRSECPIESGVIYTKWGAVKAGLVLAGVAAGLNYQQVKTENGTLDNRYGSTIAGELSEGCLYQETSDKKIGIKGGWNSTVVPKYYFLEEKSKLQVTDAEIRGGLDGLYIALNIDSWRQKFANLKVSQVFDMYYSSRGVFNKTIRACNRKVIETSMTSTETLTAETCQFNFILNEKSTSTFSPSKSTFYKQAQKTVESFHNYLPTMNDVQCPVDEQIIERASTDILIIVDLNWDFRTIESLISYILENIDVGDYETSYTVLNGQNGALLVNKSTSILDFFELYNITQHEQGPKGFDFKKAISLAESTYKGKLNNKTDQASQSTIILLAPHASPTDAEKQYVSERRQDIFKRFLPDLRIFVVGSGATGDYSDFVSAPSNDIFNIQDNADDSALLDTANKMIDRIKEIPRNVVNPNCGSKFQSENPNSFDTTHYVEPSGINYHKVSPHYFYSGGEKIYLKIKGQNYGTLSVCRSRTVSNPRNTSVDEPCQNIVSDEVSVDITNFCKDKSVSSCHPIYVSVEGLTSNINCNEANCRFPDSIKYIITLQNVGCESSSERLISFSFTNIIFITFLIHYITFNY